MFSGGVRQARCAIVTGVQTCALPICFTDLGTVGDDYLLWFHHLPWGYRMASGDGLWNTLVRRYGRGVDAVAAMQRIWAGLDRYVDRERYAKAATFLAIQHPEAGWWRDADRKSVV